MRRLKFRRIADSLPNEPRRRRQAVIRWIYIAGVVGLAAVLADIFAGSLFYLRSEGLVVGDAAVIAAEFPVTIRDIRVHQGDRVHAGDIAATVSSQSVTEAIARLTGELASREVRLSELRIRGETVDAIVGFAATRHLIAANARKELETLMERGLLSIEKRTAAVETEYRSEQDLSSLKAERRVIEGEMGSLAGVLGEARIAIGELRRLYDQGQMRVPIDGIVGRVAAEQGAVVRAGEPLFEIYGEQRYVLGYLPTGGLHEIKLGDRVTIETGLQTTEGIVARVEPIAAALPREFQGAFTPVERQQVIRIEFAQGGNAAAAFYQGQTTVRDPAAALAPLDLVRRGSRTANSASRAATDATSSWFPQLGWYKNRLCRFLCLPADCAEIGHHSQQGADRHRHCNGLRQDRDSRHLRPVTRPCSGNGSALAGHALGSYRPHQDIAGPRPRLRHGALFRAIGGAFRRPGHRHRSVAEDGRPGPPQARDRKRGLPAGLGRGACAPGWLRRSRVHVDGLPSSDRPKRCRTGMPSRLARGRLCLHPQRHP